MDRKKILFIGSFKLPKNGHYGGVYFASTTLRDGLKKEGFQIVEMDTTLKDISESRVYKRLPDIIVRQIKFLLTIFFNLKAKYLFVFLSGGASYIDKFLPILFSKLTFKKIIIFPRSGHLVNDYKKIKYKPFIKGVLKLSDKIICQSAFWKSYFSDLKVNQLKLTIIENWVDDNKIRKYKYLSYPNYNGNSGALFKIVFVSRIEKAKGIDKIISLVKKLKNDMNLSVHIYGAGSYEKELIDNIKKNNLGENLKFCGWLHKENMQEIINSYHLAVFPSHIEGYPNALLDYIFSKVPVVASNIPMVRAVGGAMINYYEANDTGDLVDKVKIVATDYKQAIQNAEELYESKCIQNALSASMDKLTQIL